MTRKHIIFLILGVCLLVGLGASSTPAETAQGVTGTDWPMWGCDPAHTFTSPDPGFQPPLKVVWRCKGMFRSGHFHQHAPVVYQGTVYATTEDTQVIALDAKTGKRKWLSAAGFSKNHLFLAAAKGLILTGNQAGLTALDAESGALRWKFTPKDAELQVPSSAAAFPLVMDDLAYVMDRQSVLHAVSLPDGKEKWSQKTGGRAFAASGGNLYAYGDTTGSCKVHCLRADTGKEIWSVDMYPPRRYCTPSMASDGERVYLAIIGPQPGRIVCLSARDGTRLWESPKEPTYHVFVTNGLVISYKKGEVILALDAKTGQKRWSVPLHSPHCGPLTSAAGRLYAPGSGILTVLNVQNGEPLGQYGQASGLSTAHSCEGLVIGCGMGFIIGADHVLYALAPDR